MSVSPCEPEGGGLQEFMIKSLVSRMVEQQRQKEKEAFEKMEAEREVQKARMLEEKEARKAEAKERSRLRREAQEAADTIKEQFKSGQITVDEFMKQFKPARERYHLRKNKTDSFAQSQARSAR